MAALAAQAQEPVPPPDTLPADSTHVDSIAAADTLAAGDSTVSGTDSSTIPAARAVIRDIGAPLGALVPLEDGAGYDLLTKRALVWERYYTAFDALAPLLPAYPLSQGGPGLVRTFSYAGSSPESISGLFNGRPFGGPGGRAYDPELYPVEFLERVEILRGARAAILGTGESLIALNFVEPRYDVEGSYVRLWYAQGENNTTNADITYARNVFDHANLSLGFRRLASDGVFTGANQSVSGWSGRGALRWDVADNLSFSLTEIFSDATRGLNGGLTPASPSDPIFADVVNDTLRERTLRHDLTFATRWYPRMLDRMPGDTLPGRIVDSALRIDGDLYFTYAERELQVGERRALLGDAYERAAILGARAGLAIPLERFQLLANGVVEHDQAGEFRFEAGGLLEVPLGSILTIRGGGKIHGHGENVFATVTGEGVAMLGDSLTLRGTIRSMNLLGAGPGCPPPDDADGWNRPGNYYTTSLVEGALEWQGGGWKWELEGFLRGAAPFCPDDASYTIAGAALRASIPYKFLTLENNLIGTFSGEEFHGIPYLYGTSDLFAQLRLFGGNLDLRLGTVLEYMSSAPVIRYIDQDGVFALPKGSTLAGGPPSPVWSAYAQGRIGTAYIRVEMYNILDNFFVTTYRYPVFGRSINISVNWALVD